MTEDQTIDTEIVSAEEVKDSNDFSGEIVEENNLNTDDKVSKSAKELEAIYDVPVKLQAVLGHAEMKVSQMLKLGRGAVVELDKKVGEAIDIYVNNRLVARGEILIVDDKLGISMTEIIKANAIEE